MPNKNKTTVKESAIRLALVGACLLAAWSLFDAWSWSLPRLTTTGCEEEALFPIWKFARNESVYADPQSVPFSVSYYNWLFFFTYGGVVKTLFALFSFDDFALPIITRLLTLGFAAASIGIIYVILGSLGNTPATRLGRLTVSLFVVLNPLTGFWTLTARPDMAALACELAGLWCALRFANTRRASFLLATVLASYAAWSFKQNFVHLMGGLSIYLLLRRQWRELALATSTFIVLAGATLMIGGSSYRNALIGAQMNCTVSVATSIEMFQGAMSLAPHLIAIALTLAMVAALRGRWLKSETGTLLAGIVAVAVGIGFLGAAKQGADTNYFIPASVFGILWGIHLCAATGTEFSVFGAAAFFRRWGIVATFCASVVIGLLPTVRKAGTEMTRLFGNGDAAENNLASEIGQEVARLRRHLDELPGPVFVTDRACNLPWIQRKAPYFVYSFMYAVDRKAGLKFESGGIGGLIEQGYFETIVVLERNCSCESGVASPRCPHTTMGHLPLVKDGEVPSIDGGRMRQYRLAFRDGAFTYYRKEPWGEALQLSNSIK